MKHPVALIIMDGWGMGQPTSSNAVNVANTPNVDRYLKEYPHTRIAASGLDVGLPDGQMGNSEVGHLNIGGGRIVYQALTRISLAIEDGGFFENPELLMACDSAVAEGKSLHLMGLLSDGGVHSHTGHLKGLIDLAARKKMKNVYVHAILDGRDTAPQSALTYVSEIEAYMKEKGVGQIASVSGRYYTMDRDTRWERTEKAYKALVDGTAESAPSAVQAVEAAYANGQTDEFVLPTLIDGVDGAIREKDSVIFFNFRPDRARQITRALVDPEFDGFARKAPATTFVCMTEYDSTIPNVSVAFKPVRLTNTLGEYLASCGKTQLRIAETEKYAHVTFFFNGGVEEPNPGEERVLIPSPQVATYDLKPEMSAPEVTDALLDKIREGAHDLIVLNFANPDMVGHTGITEAAVKAVETVDTCLGRVVDALTGRNGKIIITADHGNAEMMVDETTGGPMTAHTTNPVPCIIIGEENCSLPENARLSDLAPTLLKMMGLEKPEEMTGTSLI